MAALTRVPLVAILLAAAGCAGGRTDAEAASVPAQAHRGEQVVHSPATQNAQSQIALGGMDPALAAAAALADRAPPADPPQVEHLRQGHQPPNFDRTRYLADPAAYLDHADGNRAHAPAQPAADVPMLEPVGGTTYRIPILGSCVLMARTEPGMPVSFFSYGLGRFDSDQTAISVAADATGVARARFTASAGTVGECGISAASPVRGGVLHYLVRIDD